MKRIAGTATALALLLSLAPAPAEAGELNGSRASMIEQNRVAKESDYTFLRTPSQVRRFVDLGLLRPLAGNADYELAKVSFPYARPETRMFIERLAAQFRAATGERLVVTSLTRPASSQPRNSHPLSVHPAGMAVDLRVPASRAAERWLDDALLSLERAGVLEATREHRPPHFHVAVYPDAYRAHVAVLLARDAEREAARAAQRERLAAARTPATPGDDIAVVNAPLAATAGPTGGPAARTAALLVLGLVALGTALAHAHVRRE